MCKRPCPPRPGSLAGSSDLDFKQRAVFVDRFSSLNVSERLQYRSKERYAKRAPYAAPSAQVNR